ncbi:MAG: YIP1 family protein [Archangium sp.]|nr:YIP1 family protein [Archangium sp.]MDP3158324.1 YIP1 family protein [Archangium sp.]MDP3569585.1 YIP1 family protein [Archangium sp.]
MEALTLPLRALLDPVGAIPRAVETRRWFVPLLLVAVLTAGAGASIAVRLDTARTVIPKMQMSGELMKASEREVNEAIEQAGRVALVGGIAKGLMLMPLLVLLLAVVLKIAAWLIGRKALFADLFTVAALAMLPLAVFHGIEVVAALKLEVITPLVAETLVPTSLSSVMAMASPALKRVYTAVDLINIWVALLMGLGFAAASKWAPWKGALFGLFLYVLFAAAFFVGLPGLTEGMGG